MYKLSAIIYKSFVSDNGHQLSRRSVIVPKSDRDQYGFYMEDDDQYSDSADNDVQISYGKGPVYRPLTRKPRLLGPFPLGGLTKKYPIRQPPRGSILILTSTILIPFIPFGIFELRLPVAFFLNYIVDRLNG